jgi:PAS domain S-box-containing protein
MRSIAVKVEKFRIPVKPARAKSDVVEKNLFYEAIIDTLCELSEVLSPFQILKTIVKNVGKILRADRCSFILIDEIKRKGKVVVTYENPKVKGLILDLDTYPELRKAMRTRKEVIIDDVKTDPLLADVRKKHPELGGGSILIIPIVFKSNICGTFFLRTRRLDRPFSPDEIEFCRKIGIVSADALLKAYQLLKLRKDIEKQTTEKRLIEESARKYQAMIEDAPWAIFVYQAGAVQFANKNFRKMAGLKKNQVLALKALLDGEWAGMVEREFKTLLTGAAQSCALRVRRANKKGQDAYWKLEAGLVEYQGAPAVECITKDITYEKHLENLLEAQNRSLSEAKEELETKNKELTVLYEQLKKAHTNKTKFLRLLSHELKNPLGVLSDYFSLLLDGMFGPVTKEQAEILAESSQLGREILDLVISLLDYSKIEAGKVKYNFGQHSVSALAESALMGYYNQAKLKGIKIENHIAPALPVVRVDAEKISIVLKNLLANAMKHTPSGGKIKIAAQWLASPAAAKANGHVEISVMDTGPGIPEEYHEEIFNEFFQLHNSTERHKGAGLGLFIVREIIQHHQGEIWVDKTYRAGAKFTFVLPVNAK